MKNLVVIVTCFLFGFAVSAQTATSPKDEKGVQTTAQPAGAEKKVPDNQYVKMKDGKLLFTKNGSTMELKEEITLGETKVKPDGTVILKDGTTTTMKEGNIVNVNGRLIDMAAFKKSAEQKKIEQTAPPK